jgi:hypothetical protein
MMSLAERRSVTAENLLQAVAEQAKKTINLILQRRRAGLAAGARGPALERHAREVDVKLLHSGLGTSPRATSTWRTSDGDRARLPRRRQRQGARRAPSARHRRSGPTT